jgi:hypothetical protein
MSTVRALNAGPPGAGTTTNLMSGLAKAWINFDGTGNSIRSSFNTSSLTKNTTGDYRINTTSAFSSTNIAPTGSASNAGSGIRLVACSIENASRIRAYGGTPISGSATDVDFVSVAAHGDLA